MLINVEQLVFVCSQLMFSVSCVHCHAIFCCWQLSSSNKNGGDVSLTGLNLHIRQNFTFSDLYVHMPRVYKKFLKCLRKRKEQEYHSKN